MKNHNTTTMEKKTVIHIGLHKTASTFLQRVLFPKVQSYTYLTRPYIQHNFAFNKLQYADDSLFQYSEVEEELERINYEKLLISDEALSGKPVCFGYINRTIIAERMSKLFPNASIIMFIRGQKDILLSHYNMWVKGYNAGYRSIDDFIWHADQDYTINDYREGKRAELDTLYWNSNKFYLNIECFKYYELISLYKRLFKNVHVFLYEDFVNDPKSICSQIESILGTKIEIPENELERKVNKSLSQTDLNNRVAINKTKILTKSKFFQGLLFYSLKLGKSNNVNPKEYIDKISNNVFEDNNMKLIQQFPEVGIQKYPNAYNTFVTKEKEVVDTLVNT